MSTIRGSPLYSGNSWGASRSSSNDEDVVNAWTSGNLNVAATNFSEVGQTLRRLHRPIGENPTSLSIVEDAERIAAFSLLFVDSDDLERWFRSYFYLRNKRSAYLGIIIALPIIVLVVIIGSRDTPGLTLAVPMYSSLLLSVLASVSASINLFVQGKFHPRYHASMANLNMNTNKSNHTAAHAAPPHQLILRDNTSYNLFLWWEVSMLFQQLAAVALSVTTVVGKNAGCIGTTDPVASQRCTVTIQFDAAMVTYIIANGIIFPVRWVFHIFICAAMLVSLFGIRYVPGLSDVDTRYIISYAFVIVVPMAVFLVVRYLRERQLRKMFLSEIQLEAALEQQREMSAWHEMLLVPWVPLPVEEQLRLLRTASDHLWGLQENTFVGVVQLANFGPWVMQAGACEAARALSTVVATMDKYYEILSPLAVSVLKCHLDGDRYALVAPRSNDAGLLSLILLAGSYEFSGYHLEHINGCPELHVAVSCGVLGVAGISVSGTLIPVGQPMEQIQRLLSQQSPHHHHHHLACSLRMTANVLEQSPALKSRLSLKLEPLESLPHLADEAMVRRVINRAAVNIGDLAGPHGQTVTSLLESDLLGGELCTTEPLFSIFLVPLDTPHEANDWIATPLTHIIPSLQVVAEENTTAFHQSSSTANTLGDSELTNSVEIAQRVSSAASMPHGVHKADVNNPAHRHSQRSARDRHEPRDSRHLVVSNFSTARKSFLLLSFVDADVERRFREHSRDFMSWPELMASSVGAAATALILIIICVMYGNTAVLTVSPLPFAIAALVIGVALVGCAAAHQHQFVVGRRPLQHVLLVLHEFLFVCFYAMIVGADYSAEPQTSAAGDTQLVWLLILFSLNVVRPKVHGVAPHLLIDVIGCVLFVVQALLYPYPSTLMRWLNVLGDVVTGLGSVIVNTSFDFESRQRFVVEVSLEQLHNNLIILNEELNIMLASTQANNPAAIFLSRSEARRAHQRARRRRLMNPFSPLCIDNIDPSTSTTRASRVMDGGVLLLEFVPLSSNDDLAGAKVLQTTSALRAGVAASKAFLASVAALLESQFKRRLRIVKATPTTLLVLTDVCVLGRSAASEAGSDLALLELGLDVVRVVCPRHGLVGRAVADSGPMIGVLLGTSSISFEFTGPVIERSRGLLRAAPWGACFATRRLLRYCGVDSDAAMPLVTPSGLRGRTTGQWESWRVRGQPKVSVAPLIL